MNQVYDKKTIRLHWISAALVIGLWIAGQCIDFFPKGTPRITVRSLHICFGVLLAVILAVRLSWRFGAGVKLPAADAGLIGRTAIGVHHLLYLLLVAIVLIGAACVWLRGDNIFNLFTVPALDVTDKSLRHDAVELHGLIANILLAVAGLHALAAIFHHVVLKDEVLARMLPRLSDKSRSDQT